MKILIFGAKGYMGENFLSIYPDANTPETDITDRRAVSEILDVEKPEVMINCSGKTGRPNVDWCEDHKLETIHSNVLGPLILLEECAKRNLYWVQMSTGCIYEGNNGGKGFTEEDPPNFTGSFYARSKGWIDQILKDFPVLQLRLRMPFSNEPHPRNLITKLTKYERILDAENSLTYIPDFLSATKRLIEKKATGIYTIVNPGTISPYRVMELYKESVDPLHEFERLSLEDLPNEVKAGRSNCVLSIKKLESEGIKMQPVEEAVKRALQMYKTHS